MPYVHSFNPVSKPDARLLILGSMPGRRSLEQQQYYAHPSNAFWKIMGKLVGASPQLPYAERLQALTAAGIALWEVLAACERETSLDARIRNESVNDFAAFFKCHAGIDHVYFNGGKAELSFRKQVMAEQRLPALELWRLPSTSPAHANMSFEEKLRHWRILLR